MIDTSDLESAREDPFADPYAKMRSRPYIPSVSPTIRTSDPPTNPFSDPPKSGSRDEGLVAIGAAFHSSSTAVSHPSPISSSSSKGGYLHPSSAAAMTPTTRNRFSRGSESMYSTESATPSTAAAIANVSNGDSAVFYPFPTQLSSLFVLLAVLW